MDVASVKSDSTLKCNEKIELVPRPLKMCHANSVTEGFEVSKSSRVSKCYAMDNDVNKTISAEVVPMPRNLESVDGDAAITSRIEEEVVGSFVRAVHKKYSDIGKIEYCFLGGLVLPKCSAVKVTESGSMLLPNQVSMSGCEISVAGNTDLIRRMCQNVTHLDLMANDIKCWNEVVSILECIPTLNFLNLSKNHINSTLPCLDGRSLPNLTHLVLNDSNMSWDVLLTLLHVCPQIEELHLSLNGFTSIDIPDNHQTHPSVQKLFFIGNQVTDWSSINKLGKLFSNLQSIMLCETAICSLGCRDDLAQSFPSLKVLSLNRSCLDAWEEVEKLDCFPCLTDVRLRFIPFFENLPTKDRRQRQIASLPKITMLNKSPISEDEREDAERAFIRFYMDADNKPERYYHLVSKHGSIEPLAKVDLRPQDTVRVKIIIDDGKEEEEEEDSSKTSMVTTSTTRAVEEERGKETESKHGGTEAITLDAINIEINSKTETRVEVTNSSDATQITAIEKNENSTKTKEINKTGTVIPSTDNVPKLNISTAFTVSSRDFYYEVEKKEKPGEMMDLDVHMTVKSLRKMLSNVVHHPAAKLTLFYDDKGLNQGPVKMIYPDRKLLAYRVRDGDDIIVMKRD